MIYYFFTIVAAVLTVWSIVYFIRCYAEERHYHHIMREAKKQQEKRKESPPKPPSEKPHEQSIIEAWKNSPPAEEEGLFRTFFHFPKKHQDNEDISTSKTPSTFVEQSTVCPDDSSILEAEEKERQRKKQSSGQAMPSPAPNEQASKPQPIIHSTSQSATSPATDSKRTTSPGQYNEPKQIIFQSPTTTGSRASAPVKQPAKPDTPIGIIQVPKLKIAPGYFTPAQEIKYQQRGSSMRLGRALTQGMLLEHLKTDKTTTPYTASATVHSLKSGMQYKTMLTSCSCPDYQKRQEPCKHMLALAIYVGAIKLDEN